MRNRCLSWMTTVALVLAFLVIVLGAYTRLSDAGLGCPDWPGCYGRMLLPQSEQQVSALRSKYPETPLESKKAWTEMIHRYAAGSLALLIVLIGLDVAVKRYQGILLPWRLPLLLFCLVLAQAVLGRWTVTLKLLPVVVMTHLLGGILIFSCLCRYRLALSTHVTMMSKRWHPWLFVALLLLSVQIALGGWVSANYAGLACVGFPQCNGLWFPSLYFEKGFHLLSPLGANYQGGLLDNEVRVGIAWVHRLGAVLTLSYLFPLFLTIGFKTRFKRFAWAAAALVLGQFILGILNVWYRLPLAVALAHHAGAALLFASLLMMLYLARGGPVDAN